MKKIIMMIVLFMFVSLNAFADCSPTQGKIIYGPAVDAPVEINYQTGVGYCSPSENVGGVIVDLSNCDRVNELIPGNDYVLLLSIKTAGFSFLKPAADATNTSIAVKAYTTMDNLCNDEDGVSISLDASYDEDASRIISSPSDAFVLVAHPFLLVTIQSVIYDENLVDGSDLNVEVSIIDSNVICITCNDAICTNTFDLGSMSCVDSYSLLYPYGVYNDANWWTGITIANLTNQTGTANIEVYANGDKFSFTKTVEGNKVFAITIDELLGNNIVSGSRCYIVVNSNFKMDGVCIYGDSTGQSAYAAQK